MKLKEYWRKILLIYEGLEELIDELEEEQNTIEEKEYIMEINEARHSEIFNQIDAIRKCMNNLNSAMLDIESYRK